MTSAQAKALLREPDSVSPGKPDAIENANEGETWHYSRVDKEETKRIDVRLWVDKSFCRNIIVQHRLLNPATLTVEICEAYWRDHVEAQLGTDSLSGGKGKCAIEVSADQGNTSFPLTENSSGESASGRVYSRQFVAGAYDLYVDLWEVEDRSGTRTKRIKHIPLHPGLELQPDEKKTLTFE
jgi:hypothetical protein